jgi:hypothetical protein
MPLHTPLPPHAAAPAPAAENPPPDDHKHDEKHKRHHSENKRSAIAEALTPSTTTKVKVGVTAAAIFGSLAFLAYRYPKLQFAARFRSESSFAIYFIIDLPASEKKAPALRTRKKVPLWFRECFLVAGALCFRVKPRALEHAAIHADAHDDAHGESGGSKMMEFVVEITKNSDNWSALLHNDDTLKQLHDDDRELMSFVVDRTKRNIRRLKT